MNSHAFSVSAGATGMYDVGDIATLLKASNRHVRRLADSGRMPRPLHIGRLVRWRIAEVDEWLAAGCPSCRPTKGGAR